jgi:hypothetical protein
VEFLNRNRMELAYFNILTPLPGTALFERMKREGRIFDFDWSNYDGKHVVFWPKRMSPKTLQDGFFWANHEFFSWRSIARRILPTAQRLVARGAMNVAFRHLVKRTAPKGSLSPLSKVIQSLHVKLPSLTTENLIPNALNTLKEKAADAAQQIDRFLHIQVKRGDIARAEADTTPLRSSLHLDLIGTLDEPGAKELRQRLLDAVRQAAKLEIIVNFEHVRYATPQAVSALLDGEYLKALKAHASVRFVNLKKAFQAAVERITRNPLSGATRRSANMHDFLEVDGELYCEQVPVAKIAKAVGTPFYLYSHKTLSAHFRAVDGAFASIPHVTAFAMKANSNLAIVRLFASLGGGADIVSGGELYRALKAGVPRDKIVFAGVGKSREEIAEALKAKILLFNVESAQVGAIDDVAHKLKTPARISLRVNPHIDPKTHPYISTGLKKSKFGIAIDQALDHYKQAATLKGLDIVGVHHHIGSQLTQVQPFVEALARVLELVEVLKRHGVTIRYLDMGGGLGIPYRMSCRRRRENSPSRVAVIAGA